MNKFNATIEFLPGRKAAIVSLTDDTGEWVCGGRVETNCGSHCGHSIHDSLYEIGYTHASLSAQSKGGTIETYKVVS
jgi:hypothetical protein